MLKKLALACTAVLALTGLLTVGFVTFVVSTSRHEQGSKRADDSVKPLSSQLDAEERYLELLKRVLARYGMTNGYAPLEEPPSAFKKWAYSTFNRAMVGRNKQLVQYHAGTLEETEEGSESALRVGETMIGLKRLDNIQFCVTDVIRRNVPGDLIECGAWRGGACIFMRAVLAAHGVKDRKVWVADSFEGLPRPKEDQFPEAHIWNGGEMAVSLEEAQNNFRKYGLLDDQVKFLKGFFIDTLPKAPIQQLAVLRVDGDLYESVTQTLDYMYPKVSVGGYIILDDYYRLPPAKKAEDDYRKAHGITTPLMPIDGTGAFWRKEN